MSRKIRIVMTFLAHVKRLFALVKLSKTKISGLTHVLRKIAKTIFQSKHQNFKGGPEGSSDPEF